MYLRSPEILHGGKEKNQIIAVSKFNDRRNIHSLYISEITSRKTIGNLTILMSGNSGHDSFPFFVPFKLALDIVNRF